MYQGIKSKCLTGEVRLSYVHLIEPYNNGKTEKYSATLLIPKTDTATYEDLRASIDAVYEDAVATCWKGRRPALRTPLIWDGDGTRQNGSEFAPECRGHWVLAASTKRKPQVVHISNIVQPLGPEDVYSGMYARVTVNFYAYTRPDGAGVACGLGNVLKIRDGERLGGGASAAQDFAGLAITPPPEGWDVPQQQQYNYGGYAQQPQPGYADYGAPGYQADPANGTY